MKKKKLYIYIYIYIYCLVFSDNVLQFRHVMVIIIKSDLLHLNAPC